MDKIFTPHNIEKRIYDAWNESGLFQPTFDANKENFCIVIPPPNVTGTLHMGHAFQQTLMDIMVRYHRMLGKNTLWQTGTDHAGIATQMVVERKIAAEEGKTRHDYGRDAFIEKVWEWKRYSGGTINKQIARLGASVDWTRDAFTMDEPRSRAVKKVFIELFDEGLIYRGKRLVNWDPKLKTAISDLEVENRDVDGNLWYVRYSLEQGVTTLDGKDYIVVATTRPETIFGDTAVAVNPEDERYLSLVGKKVFIPVVGRWVPVVADEYVEREFGTGVVKITPAHDFNDYEVGKRHSLDMISVLDFEANMLHKATILNTEGRETGDFYELPEHYQGIDRFAARKQLIAEYEQLGVLEKIEPHKMVVPYGDRGGVVIEPMLTDQWYVNVKPMAKLALDLVAKGEIRFVPEQYTNMYNNWLQNIQDWCISRQLWWGHRIPAWYDKDGNVYVGEDEVSVRTKYNLANELELTQDEDVLDTWFSSALWTFSTLGWPEQTQELKFFHPTSVLVTGFDIIFFWVSRMIMMTTHFLKNDDGSVQIPFKDVYITGLINDEEGNKMSKSKGNVLDPLDMIDGISLEELIAKRTSNMMQPQLAEKIAKRTAKQFPEGILPHGTDALRFTLASFASSGRNISWDMKRLEGYRNFCNKLWNASRLVFMHLEQFNGKLTLDQESLDTYSKFFTQAEEYIEDKLVETIKAVDFAIETYRFDHLANSIYDFIWNTYCNWYLEIAKVNLHSEDKNIATATLFQMVRILEATLRLTHIVMPYITEEIWQNLKNHVNGLDGFLMGQNYPRCHEFTSNPQATASIEQMQGIITTVRELRAEMNINPGKELNVSFVPATDSDISFLQTTRHFILKIAKLASLVETQQSSTEIMVTRMFGNHKLEFAMSEIIDVAQELQRLDKEIVKVQSEIARIDNKLANQSFVERAPADLIEKEKNKREFYITQLAELEQQISKIKALA